MVKAADDERTLWFDSGSKTLQNERTDARFGDLVRYWLAGQTGTIPPGKLEAVQEAAMRLGITYGNLTNTDLNDAIVEYAEAEKKVNDRAADVYKKSDGVDSARVTAEAAKTAVKDADTAVGLADKAVKEAELRVKDARRQSGSGAQAVLDKEEADLSAATMALKASQKDRDDKKKASGVATRALDTAKTARDDEKTRHNQAKTARRLLDSETKKNRNRKEILKALEKAKETLLKAGGTKRLVENALEAAHRSRADMSAWSAAFVVSCVRKAAIDLKLEAIDSVGTHRGRDGLLKASRRHSDYIVEARERKRGAVGGKYHAFEPSARIVQVGDIICTDRKDFIKKPVLLKDLDPKDGPVLHGDIVTEVRWWPGFAETIGGNVGHTVRRRRYPWTGWAGWSCRQTGCLIKSLTTGRSSGPYRHRRCLQPQRCSR